MANIYIIKKGVEVFRINFFMSFFRFRDYGGFGGRLCTKTAGISLEGINFEIMTSSIYVLMEKKECRPPGKRTAVDKARLRRARGTINWLRFD